MIHRIIHDRKLILSVAPRAGHHTITDFVDAIVSKEAERQTWRSVEDIMRHPDYVKIKFVRNPYHRVVSSYYAVCGNFELGLYKNCFGLSEEEALRMTFFEFLEVLEKKDLSCVDHHIDYQKSRGEGVAFRYDAIIKIETLLKDINKICGRFCIPLERSVNLVNSLKKVSSSEKCYDVPFCELRLRFPEKSMPKYENFYNDEIERLVFKLFEEDIAFNGYDLTPKVFAGVAKYFKKERSETEFSSKNSQAKLGSSLFRKSHAGCRKPGLTRDRRLDKGLAKNLIGVLTSSKTFLRLAMAILEGIKNLSNFLLSRKAEDHFNPTVYLVLYPELKKRWNSPFKARLHWILFGKRESRRIKL